MKNTKQNAYAIWMLGLIVDCGVAVALMERPMAVFIGFVLAVSLCAAPVIFP